MDPSLAETLHRVLYLVPDLAGRPEHSGWQESYVHELCERLIAAEEQGDRAGEAETAAALQEWVILVREESPRLPSLFRDRLDDLEAHLQATIEQTTPDGTRPRGVHIGNMAGGSIVVGGLVQSINRDQVRDS